MSPPTSSEAIVAGIAERANADPTELPPLYTVVDPEALNAVAQGSDACYVTFEYAGYEVTVAGPNRISIHEVAYDRPGEADESSSIDAESATDERE